MAQCPECGAKTFSSYTKCRECGSDSIQAREWLGDSEEKTKITSTNDSANTHNQRSKKPTSVSGFGVKLLGGAILAIYWTILFINSLIESEAPSYTSLAGLVDDAILAMRIHMLVHALSFWLIVIGWLSENTDLSSRLNRIKKRLESDKTRRI